MKGRTPALCFKKSRQRRCSSLPSKISRLLKLPYEDCQRQLSPEINMFGRSCSRCFPVVSPPGRRWFLWSARRHQEAVFGRGGETSSSNLIYIHCCTLYHPHFLSHQNLSMQNLSSSHTSILLIRNSMMKLKITDVYFHM